MYLEDARREFSTNMYIRKEGGEDTVAAITRANRQGWRIIGLSWAQLSQHGGGSLPQKLTSLAPEFGKDNLYCVSNNNGVYNWICVAHSVKVGSGEYIFFTPTEKGGA